jgi:hypothetical protein
VPNSCVSFLYAFGSYLMLGKFILKNISFIHFLFIFLILEISIQCFHLFRNGILIFMKWFFHKEQKSNFLHFTILFEPVLFICLRYSTNCSLFLLASFSIDSTLHELSSSWFFNWVWDSILSSWCDSSWVSFCSWCLFYSSGTIYFLSLTPFGIIYTHFQFEFSFFASSSWVWNSRIYALYFWFWNLLCSLLFLSK